MRKVEYPHDIKSLKKEYLSIFDLKKINKKWEEARNSCVFLETFFPKKIQKLLLADFNHLLKYYLRFKNRSVADISDAQIKTLREIFNYADSYQPIIADFFATNSCLFNLSVCHYCETAYINNYVILESDEDNLYYLNNASFEELRKKLGIKDLSITKIIRERPIKSIEDLDNFGSRENLWHTPNKVRKLFPKSRRKTQFDIDHVLDKGTCPLVALSLFNLVPSCQICNQRLKKSYSLGDIKTGIPIEHLSPTSPKFDFENNVEIRLIPQKKDDGTFPNPAFAVYESKHYDLKFFSNEDYEHLISLFHLNERYQFHKAEGLYWIQIKSRYPDSAISMMASSLGRPELSEYRIKEDLYRFDYDAIRKPVFYKLKKDCLK